MICIDDLNDWTGFLGGHPDVLTPHMDKLAKRGRSFANEQWFDLYDINKITLPKTPLADLEDVPKHFLGINEISVTPTHAEVVKHGKQRALTQACLVSVSFVDHCVGTVLEALADSPHANNTIVVLWSDHGLHLGEKRHWAKRTLREESTRVPFIFAGPGIVPGDACREPASLLDIYPTLVKLCGLPANERLEGVSLTPSHTPRTTHRSALHRLRLCGKPPDGAKSASRQA